VTASDAIAGPVIAASARFCSRTAWAARISVCTDASRILPVDTASAASFVSVMMPSSTSWATTWSGVHWTESDAGPGTGG
jgi:hypothetical protein